MRQEFSSLPASGRPTGLLHLIEQDEKERLRLTKGGDRHRLVM
jgi:hypothetical protein